MLLISTFMLSLLKTALGDCPCVQGGVWKYEGREYSYCSNPNQASTSWCPKKVHSDGSYTSELPFTFCEGQVLDDCEKLKKEKKPSCPCVKGGDWKFRGKPQSYCADPANSGFYWCATKVDSAGNYKSDYAVCTDTIKEVCDEEKEANPLPLCPCLPGGQWTFDGEKQSYCQKPNGIGGSEWCPTSTSNAAVTSSSLSKEGMAFCEGRVLEACQRLEGTKPPATCPCVEGGDWKYLGKQYSYCNQRGWCATKVNSKGEYYNGNFALCKGKEKDACDQLKSLKTESGRNQLFSKYTKESSGCPCWFDLSRSDCACCQEDGVQCGHPMQNYCTSKSEGRVAGCLGVPSNHWTLSSTGYPCYFNTSRTDCGWCAAGGAQCGEGDKQGECWDSEDLSYCDSVPGDCRHIPVCDSQATCKFHVKFGKRRQHSKCQCNAGWTGNGIQCYDSKGAPSPENTGNSVDVSVTLGVRSRYYVFPHNSSLFPQAEGENDLVKNIAEVFQSGASCSQRDNCNGTYVNLVEKP